MPDTLYVLTLLKNRQRRTSHFGFTRVKHLKSNGGIMLRLLSAMR